MKPSKAKMIRVEIPGPTVPLVPKEQEYGWQKPPYVREGNTTFSIGIFKWGSTSFNGKKKLKPGKAVFRVRGYTSDPEDLYRLANYICHVMNTQPFTVAGKGVSVDGSLEWIRTSKAGPQERTFLSDIEMQSIVLPKVLVRNPEPKRHVIFSGMPVSNSGS